MPTGAPLFQARRQHGRRVRRRRLRIREADVPRRVRRVRQGYGSPLPPARRPPGVLQRLFQPAQAAERQFVLQVLDATTAPTPIQRTLSAASAAQYSPLRNRETLLFPGGSLWFAAKRQPLVPRWPQILSADGFDRLTTSFTDSVDYACADRSFNFTKCLAPTFVGRATYFQQVERNSHWQFEDFCVFIQPCF